MGQQFRYIADDALVSTAGSACKVCGEENVTTLAYPGEWEASPGKFVRA